MEKKAVNCHNCKCYIPEVEFTELTLPDRKVIKGKIDFCLAKIGSLAKVAGVKLDTQKDAIDFINRYKGGVVYLSDTNFILELGFTLFPCQKTPSNCIQ